MIETRRELMCDTCGRSGGDHAVLYLGHPFYNAEAQAQFHGTPAAPPLKERARELVNTLLQAVSLVVNGPPTMPGNVSVTDTKAALLAFMDKHIDALASANARVAEYEELEARICPEDFGFEEVIASLRARVAELEKEVLRLRILEALSELGSEIDPSNVAALPAPTEEPGK